MQSVTAYLSVDGAAAAIDFYTRAFGAKEQYRLSMGDDRIGHAEIVIGDTLLMLADEFPEMEFLGPLKRGGATASLSIEVDSIDALDRTWAAATGAGATVQSELVDEFFGYRSGTLVDPFGHRWMIQTKLEDVSPEEMQRRMEAIDDDAG